MHDLLLQLTRPDQVSMVLGVLETQCEKGIDLGAIERLCGPDPADGAVQSVHPHLTDQGRMLWQLLLFADPQVRSAGHALFLKEMEERAPLRPARASPSLLATMPSGSLARSLAFSLRPGVPPSSGAPSTSSSHTPASDGSSPGGGGSTKQKRHARRSMGSAPVADGLQQGEDIARRADS